MSERGLEFKVGLLILVSSAILIGFIFVLGNFSLHSGFSSRSTTTTSARSSRARR